MNTEGLGLWDEAKKEIAMTMDATQFNTWVERLKFVDYDSSANKLILSAPSGFVQNICMQYNDIFEDALKYIMGMPITVEIEVSAAEEPPRTAVQNLETTDNKKDSTVQAVPKDSKKSSDTQPNNQTKTKVRPDNIMSFDSFVISHSNEFAAATAKVVAERPGLQYNPYFIWGDSGLGKTHLLHAIENYVREVFPTKKVCYVTAEEFLNDFVTSIARKTNEQFRLKYRSLDVLLIDDVQSLTKKPDTQLELFNTFNKMFDSNKQMVFSCDQPIEKVRDMEQRLVSRFSMGLTVALQPPDFELRMAILQKWAETNMLKIASDALEYVATNVTGNVRSLRGVFNTILIKASINKKSVVSKDDAALWLKDQISVVANTSPVSVDKIISETAKYYNLKPADLTGESRVKDIAYARQIAMYLARNLTALSTPQIGSHFGNKQHGTVISNVNKIQTLLDQPNEQTRYDIDTLTKKVTEN